MTATKSFYDVVILGSTLGALAAGALLARRGFRVACVRHDTQPNAYTVDGTTLLRGPSALTFLETPSARRVLDELALAPAVKRRLSPTDPLYQVALPGHRIDVRADRDALINELAREFPEVRRPVENFYDGLARDGEALDALYGADLLWPPEGYLARRRTLRLAARALVGRSERAVADPLADFPAEHPFRTFVHAQTRFGAALDPDEARALAMIRTHALSLRGAPFYEGGDDAFVRLFEEKIAQYGGELRARDRVARIGLERGRIHSVDLATTDERLGCAFLITSMDAAAAFHLAEHPTTRAAALHILAMPARYHRYVLNVVVRAEGVPPGLGARLYAVRDRDRPLCEENLLAIETSVGAERARFTVEALLPRAGVDEGERYLLRQRERVLSALGAIVPFLDRNLLFTDSPHDGRGTETKDGASTPRPAEPMAPLYASEPRAVLGVCGLPVRSEIGGLLLVGSQTLPGLGAEGTMLAALTAARIVTRTDRTKERLRRELWRERES